MEQLFNENLNILITHDKFGLKQVHGYTNKKKGKKEIRLNEQSKIIYVVNMYEH